MTGQNSEIRIFRQVDRETMPQRSAATQTAWFPRQRANVDTAERFVPIRSCVDAVRQILMHLDQDARVAVLYGAGGTGRSSVARRVGAVWNGWVTVTERPRGSYDPDEAFGGEGRTPGRAGARSGSLRIIDGLTLDHADWSALAPEALPEGQKLLIVSSTAWWLEFGRYLPFRVAGVGMGRIGPDEAAHLINALAWMKNPATDPIDPEVAAEIARQSEGVIAEVIRMAGE